MRVAFPFDGASMVELSHGACIGLSWMYVLPHQGGLKLPEGNL